MIWFIFWVYVLWLIVGSVGIASSINDESRTAAGVWGLAVGIAYAIVIASISGRFE